SGGSEAANAPILTLLDLPDKDRCELVTSEIEHPCVDAAAKFVGKKGVNVKYAGAGPDGKVRPEEFEELVTAKTALVSVILANNETGTIQDIRKISKIAKERGALVHADAAQAVGRIPVDVHDLGVDYLSFSAHKMYGPKGIGALYVRTGAVLRPMILGGSQESSRRAGTENVPGIAGFAKAVQIAGREMSSDMKRIAALRDMMMRGITKDISGAVFNTNPGDSLPNTLNVCFRQADRFSVSLYLDKAGISVSTASACASRSINPSRVLLAMGVPEEIAKCCIRISLGRDNTEEDVKNFLAVLPGIVERVRTE
ncbi:MAG: cysteine desulfurase family protein, partial [Candidatus Omnitrophica bacterium]|nr:cysteine desulfurase family protein [Candidatus Omnitrophota bacterium]